MFYSPKSTCAIYNFQSRRAVVIDYIIIFSSFTWNKNFSSVCSNCREILAWFTMMKLLHIIAIVFFFFQLLSLNMQDKISSRFSKLKFQLGVKFARIQFTPKMQLFAKIISRVHKRFHLRFLTGFGMFLCCMHDNYIFINFSIEPFLLLFVVIQSLSFFNISNFL